MKDMSEQMKERISKWLEQLSEDEKSQAEVLDAYFTFRVNLPDNDPGIGKIISEPKTTDEIIDDLQPMMPLSQNIVVGYLRSHGFGMTTVEDGTVKWAIWRVVENTDMT